MATTIKKGNAPVRYDETFKEGTIRFVNEQKRPIRETASELGICPDTLKAWLKRAGISPVSLREDKQANRIKELENEVKQSKNSISFVFIRLFELLAVHFTEKGTMPKI